MAVAAAVLFSTGGAAIKSEAFSASQVSSIRSGIAAVALLIWLQGKVSWSPAVLGVGAVYAATLTLFVAATKLTTAANAIFLQSTAPFYILLLGPLLLAERIRRRDVLYLAAVGLGLVLCFVGQPPPTATAPNPRVGNLIGLVCSVAWACTLMGLRAVQRGPAVSGAHRSSTSARDNLGVSVVIAGNVMACVLALPFAWPFPAASPAEWATLGYLGVIQIALAYICLTSAMRELPALEVSLLLLIEPVLNPLWTWLVRGEEPGRWAIVGGALIVAATGVKSVYDSRTTATKGTKTG